MSDSSYHQPGPEDIVLSDLAALVDPADIDPSDVNGGCAESYEAEPFNGVMVATGPGTEPRPITVRLNQEGVYRIWLGLFTFDMRSQFRVRLSGDRTCERISFPHPGGALWEPTLHEVCWKEADVTGQDLILESAYPHQPHVYRTALAYIRLEPIAAVSATPASTLRHPMTVTCDGYGIYGDVLHTRPDDLLEWFERVPSAAPLRTLLWGCAQGDLCNWPSKTGNRFNTLDGPYQDRFLDLFNRNLRRWEAKGWNSLEVVRDYARGRNWQFVPYIRMEAFHAHFPLPHIRSAFFQDHPEYHCRDRHDRPVGRLSYAYPEVQDHMLALFNEIASYKPDGLCLCFIRGVPLVLYERPMVEGFRAQHGADPRELDEFEPRWLTYQAEVLTAFMKRVKAVLGPNVPLSAIVPGNQHDCLWWGLDPAAWMRDGLIDVLYPTGQRFNELDVHKDAPDNVNYPYFQQLPGRDRIDLVPLLYPWDLYHKDFPRWRVFVESFLQQGADGYAVWDAIEPISRLLRTADIGCEPGTYALPESPAPRKTKLLRVEGFRFDRYHHYEVV